MKLARYFEEKIMNKVYKVVFCKATQTMVAVSEFARGRGKNSRRTARKSQTSGFVRTILALAVLVFSGQAMADIYGGSQHKVHKIEDVGPHVKIAIGLKGTKADDLGSIAIGSKSQSGVVGAKAKGKDATAIGTNSTAETQGVALGQADADKSGVAIGNDDAREAMQTQVTSKTYDTQKDKQYAYDEAAGKYYDVSLRNADGTWKSGKTEWVIETTEQKTIKEVYDKLTKATWQLCVGPDWENNCKKTKAGPAATAVGVKSQALGGMSVAVGTGAEVEEQAVLGIALGSGANSSLANSVAIGAGSLTDQTAVKQTKAQIPVYDVNGNPTGKFYEYGGFWGGADNLQPGDYVSIGKIGNERQLKNVAAGRIATNSTDAINGSQLAIFGQELEKRIAKTAGTPLTFTGNTNKDTDGAGYGKDAQKKDIYKKEDGTQRRLGEKLAIIGASKALALTRNTDEPVQGDYSAKNLQTVVSNGEVQIQMAKNPEVTSIKIVDGKNNTTLTSTADGLDVGGDKISNVLPGTKPTDAVNLSQLNTGINNQNVRTLTELRVNSPFTFAGKAPNGGKVMLVQVAERDANGSITGYKYYKPDQLDENHVPKAGQENKNYTGDVFTAAIDKNGKIIAPHRVTNIKSHLPTDNTTKGNYTPQDAEENNDAATVSDVLNAGWNLENNNAPKDFVKPYDTVNFVDGNGTVVTITPDKDSPKGKKSNVKVDVNVDDKTIVVRDGKLTAVIPDIPATSQTTGFANEDGTVAVNDTGDKVFLNANEVAKLINSASHTIKGTNSNEQVEAVDGSVKIKPGDVLTIEAGKNLNATMKDGKLQLSTTPDVNFDNVSINQGLTVAPKANIDMGGNQVHNVAAGTEPTDAVNVSQLRDGLDEVADDASAGIAGAAAMGMIAQPNESGEAIIGAGVGYHGGQAALAVGVTATSDNNNWIIKGAASVDTQKQATAGFSVNYKIW